MSIPSLFLTQYFVRKAEGAQPAVAFTVSGKEIHHGFQYAQPQPALADAPHDA
jgi:hypothetical protein